MSSLATVTPDREWTGHLDFQYRRADPYSDSSFVEDLFSLN